MELDFNLEMNIYSLLKSKTMTYFPRVHVSLAEVHVTIIAMQIHYLKCDPNIIKISAQARDLSTIGDK